MARHTKTIDDYIEKGRAFLKEGKTQGKAVEEWQQRSLEMVWYLHEDTYRQRLRDRESFTEWARGQISPKARADAIESTLRVLEKVRELEAPPRPARGAPSTQVTSDEEARLLIEEISGAFNVAAPRDIRFSTMSAMNPRSDTLVIGSDIQMGPRDEFMAVVGHELVHKARYQHSLLARTYMNTRLKLKKFLDMRPKKDVSLRLRATTMLSRVGAYGAYVVLGKTLGYREELIADREGARASSPEAMARRHQRIIEEKASQKVEEEFRHEAWPKRLKSEFHQARKNVARRLEEDHPSRTYRIRKLIGRNKP